MLTFRCAVCAQVLLARVLETGQVVALKRIYIRNPDEGLPDNIVREMKSLQAVEHPNVVQLHDVYANVRHALPTHVFARDRVCRVWVT